MTAAIIQLSFRRRRRRHVSTCASAYTTCTTLSREGHAEFPGTDSYSLADCASRFGVCGHRLPDLARRHGDGLSLAVVSDQAVLLSGRRRRDHLGTARQGPYPDFETRYDQRRDRHYDRPGDGPCPPFGFDFGAHRREMVSGTDPQYPAARAVVSGLLRAGA